MCHINMLKAYHARDAVGSLTRGNRKDTVLSVSVACDKGLTMEQENTELDAFLESEVAPLSARLSNSKTLENLSKFLGHLNADQRQDMVELPIRFYCILGDVPTITNVLQQDIIIKTTHSPLNSILIELMPLKEVS